MDTEEAAGYVKRSPRTLEGWRGVKIGPPYLKLVGRVMYDLDSLDRWMAGRSLG